MTPIVVVVLFIFFISYLINQVKKPQNYPPGPSWIPVVGNLLELKKLSHRLGGQHLALAELARRFNTNVLGLKLGNDLVVTVFSYPVIRTVHSGEEYDGRPNNFFKVAYHGNEKRIFLEDQLIMVCLDLFIGGSQTTSNTLDFAFLMMILNPDIQHKVHECLDKAFGDLENVTYGDRLRVPYIEAVLLEVQRYCTIVPISGPRRVLRDTVLEGYTIPKDTTVLISLYSVHYDKEYWIDPENFRPERFLDDEGKLLPHERLIPFGNGRRRCLAEILAKNCIFMFFVEILRKYKISLLPGTEKPTGSMKSGITMSPENYKAQFTSREKVF